MQLKNSTASMSTADKVTEMTLTSDTDVLVVENQYEEDVEHLRKLLARNNLPVFNIKHITCSAGSSNGDNYMSVVKRVCIYQHEEGNKMGDATYSFIVKRQLASPSRRQLYRCEEAFTNEIFAYKHIVPLLQRFSSQQLFPICYIAEKHDQSTTEGEPIIILEDLKALGFRLENRITGLELAHCMLVMKKLAELHAASLAAKYLHMEEYQQRAQHISEIVYCAEAAEFYSNILDASIQQAIDSLRASNIDGSLTEPIRLIERMQPKIFQQIQHNIVRGAQSELSVITHGDLWVNNIMFTSQNIDTNEQQDNDAAAAMKVIFFDLQAMRITSPVFDILHFMYTSTRRKLREMHRNTLLSTYCDALAKNLHLQLSISLAVSQLNELCDTFSLQRLSEEYMRHVYYGLAICMWILPAVTFDPNNIPNLDAISEMNQSPKQIMCTQKLTPEYHERIRELALEFYENGYLSYNLNDNHDML